VITTETFGFDEETASKYHQSKTVVLMGWTLGLERVERRVDGVGKDEPKPERGKSVGGTL
jgi:hypothetical protein